MKKYSENFDPSGKWKLMPFFDIVYSINLTKITNDSYTLEFTDWTSIVGKLYWGRNCTLRNGEIIMNVPLMIGDEYIFRSIYLIRYRNKQYLLPSCFVNKFLEMRDREDGVVETQFLFHKLNNSK